MPVRRTDAPQDDSREQDMLRVFGLRQESGSSRGDNDAYLDLDGKSPQCLELKSSTTSNFVTARDFSLQHILEWRTKHVLGSFYDKGGNAIKWSLLIPNCILNEWLDEQVSYIRCDISIIESLREDLSQEMARQVRSDIFGLKDWYTIQELKSLLKQQISKEKYLQFLDISIDGERFCSPGQMDNAIFMRTRYLLNRGTSRNNPHISDGWIKKIIDMDSRLRLVHPQGEYLRPKNWLYDLMEEYAI